ncbi:MAG: cation-translocating P-type ATPase [Actinomycetaceae bacterium]|nr:cation-translocating P-type ATPase [Actinomycetaceae bacterium]
MFITTLRAKKWISFAAAALLVAAFLFGYLGGVGGVVRDVLLVASSVLAGMPIAVSAASALRVRAFSIDLLVTIAVVGALIIGEYVEAGVVSFLFIFGAFLEARTFERTRQSIKALIDLAPTQAEVLRDGTEMTVDVDDVQVGDRVIVRSGGRIPVDGHVIHGSAVVDESTITGEPLGVTKTTDDNLWSGTVLENGYIHMRAERVGEDTTFAQIIELVEEAQDSKAATQKFLDRFATFYTPGIVIAAVIAFAVTQDLRFALTLLVIACPGALVISTPVSLVAGLGNASRNGVLMKGGDALERLARADTFVFDKTGTLTQGKPRVTRIVPVGDWQEDELLRAVATLELASEHPLGRTIVASAQERGLVLGAVPQDVQVQAGIGISGKVSLGGISKGFSEDGSLSVAIGSRRLLEAHGWIATGRGIQGEVKAGTLLQGVKTDVDVVVAGAEDLERLGNTVSFVVIDGDVAGYLAISDQVRPGVAKALTSLRSSGVKNMVMLTGDNEHTARAVAAELGIEQVFAGLMPQDKVAKVRELADSGKVAMVGDGVNDAPAIATADVGIAMGGGTDVSVQTADVILIGNRFDQLVHAKAVARATFWNMGQNTAIALVTVVFLLAGVIGGVVHMASGMLVHELSVLAVILNALRLVRYRAKTG